jgi:CheY-like chemotaxis protein
LKQILINLLKNAIKFTNNGHIDFGYDVVEDKAKTTVEFFVKDTGIGISMEQQEIIFDIFNQVDDSHTRQFGGAGIGLSISKKLTEILSGKIWVKSKIGEGSDFRFRLPFNTLTKFEISNKSKESHNNNNNNGLKGMKVLIAEDDQDNYFFLDIILQESSIQTLWAENGKSAIKYCKDNPDIDLFLMDINLPLMNGYEATSEIKKIRPELPIIAQTAYAISGDKEKALGVGCDDYISKPIKKDKLMNLIMKHIN